MGEIDLILGFVVASGHKTMFRNLETRIKDETQNIKTEIGFDKKTVMASYHSYSSVTPCMHYGLSEKLVEKTLGHWRTHDAAREC